MDTILIVFLLPVFFMLHELEEIIGIRLWLDKNGAELYNRFSRFKQIIRRLDSITTPAFTAIVAEEFILVSFCTFLSAYTGNWIAWYCCLMAFGLHLFAHIIQFLLWRRYIPVIVTSLCSFPYCIWAFRETYKFFTPCEQVGYALVGILFGALNLFVMHKIVAGNPLFR